MTTTKTRRTDAAVEQAADLVRTERATLKTWQERLTAAQAELAALEAASGEELLDDAEQAAQWPTKVREVRDRATAADRAVQAQQDRVSAAERAWCRAQADLVEQNEVTPAVKALEAHEARTQELLAALEDHDGPYVPQARLLDAQPWQDRLAEGPRVIRHPKRFALRVAAARARVRLSVLEAMASGGDVAAVVASRPASVGEDECYPEAVRPGGLVLAPTFAREHERVLALVAELEALPRELQTEIDTTLPETAAREQWPAGVLKAAVERRRARMSEVPDELEQARQQLAALSGPEVA